MKVQMVIALVLIVLISLARIPGRITAKAESHTVRRPE